MSLPLKRRFDPASFFAPASISLSGSQTPLGQKIRQNLRAGFSGVLGTRRR